jgi:CheY-like chemotaxis protein
VLTDVVMPYIDGVALTRALKKLNPEVKIIASTGQGESARTGELQSLGVDSFLSKPYTTEKLLPGRARPAGSGHSGRDSDSHIICKGGVVFGELPWA